MKLVLILVTLIVGLLMIGLAAPLILQKIPPNWFYGFRTPKTLSDEGIWYKANQYAGKALVAAGIITLIGALVLWMSRGSLSVTAINWGSIALIVVPLAMALVASFIYLKSL